MTTLTIQFENNIIEYINQKKININNYLENLIKEDMLLNEIKESKKSGITQLNSLNDLDN